LSREDWIVAARRALVSGGIANVKIDRLADQLGASRGSFYWHFSSHSELLEALVESWARTNSEAFLRILESDTDDPAAQFRNFVDVWVKERDFDPAYDNAMRDWARKSPHVKKLLHRADEVRMGALRSIFDAMGYEPLEAEIRARVTYYHQVGYYALQIREPPQTRRKLFATYLKVLSGLSIERFADGDRIAGIAGKRGRTKHR